MKKRESIIQRLLLPFPEHSQNFSIENWCFQSPKCGNGKDEWCPVCYYAFNVCVYVWVWTKLLCKNFDYTTQPIFSLWKTKRERERKYPSRYDVHVFPRKVITINREIFMVIMNFRVLNQKRFFFVFDRFLSFHRTNRLFFISFFHSIISRENICWM